jgi:hypothetical protein
MIDKPKMNDKDFNLDRQPQYTKIMIIHKSLSSGRSTLLVSDILSQVRHNILL